MIDFVEKGIRIAAVVIFIAAIALALIELTQLPIARSGPLGKTVQLVTETGLEILLLFVGTSGIAYLVITRAGNAF
jgi:hypothetical protein